MQYVLLNFIVEFQVFILFVVGMLNAMSSVLL